MTFSMTPPSMTTLSTKEQKKTTIHRANCSSLKSCSTKCRGAVHRRFYYFKEMFLFDDLILNRLGITGTSAMQSNQLALSATPILSTLSRHLVFYNKKLWKRYCHYN
jgi:hypothetical protein